MKLERQWDVSLHTGFPSLLAPKVIVVHHFAIVPSSHTQQQIDYTIAQLYNYYNYIERKLFYLIKYCHRIIILIIVNINITISSNIAININITINIIAIIIIIIT